MPTAPEDLLPLGVQGELSGSLPGTHPCRLPLFSGPPSPVSQPAKEGDLLLVNYQARRNSGRRFCGGLEFARGLLGWLLWLCVQGVGRKTTKAGAVCNREAQMPEWGF